MFGLATRCRAVAGHRKLWVKAIGLPSHTRRNALFSLPLAGPSLSRVPLSSQVCCLCSSREEGKQTTSERECEGKRGLAWESGVGATVIELRSKTEDATALVARCLAKVAGARKGDLVLLQGAVGSGKSVFCRNFIREVTGQQDLEVASPTYLLRQTYELLEDDLNVDERSDREVGVVKEVGSSRVQVQHFDLYRFNEDNLEVMLQRAYFDDCLANDVVLIEWAENLPKRYQEELKDYLVVSVEVLDIERGCDRDMAAGVGVGDGEA